MLRVRVTPIPEFPDRYNLLRITMAPFLLLAASPLAFLLTRVISRPVERMIDMLAAAGAPEDVIWEEMIRTLNYQIARHPILWSLAINMTWANEPEVYQMYQLGLAQYIQSWGISVVIET